MTPFAIAALSLSMSADAFAASISRGAATRPTLKGAIGGALVFGTIETLTPIAGWAIGLAAAGFVGAVDHWIAFALLVIVGGRMIWEAMRADGDAEDRAAPAPAGRGLLILVATALGTSIDAAAVGVTLALVGANILVIALSIGLATFTMTAIGLMIGRAAGRRLGSAVEIAGGLVLIAIGTLILVEHLGIVGQAGGA